MFAKLHEAAVIEYKLATSYVDKTIQNYFHSNKLQTMILKFIHMYLSRNFKALAAKGNVSKTSIGEAGPSI